MASPENFIGTGVCPVCHGTRAKFTLSKSRLVCMTCNGCNCQVFARSDHSDEKLRACIRSEPAAPAIPAPPAPAAPIHARAPGAAKIAPVAIPPVTEKRGIGLLGGWLS